MGKLFDLQKGQVVMNPTALWIPQLRKVWNRDKSKDKEVATREISYIVFMYQYDSPYNVYSETTKEKHIMKDFFEDMPEWEPDNVVKEAIAKFNELQDTAALRLLRTNRKSLDLIESFTDQVMEKISKGDIDITESDKIMDRIIKNAEKSGNLIQSLNKLQEVVAKEQSEHNSARGEAEIGAFED